MKKTKEESPLF